VSIRQLSSIEDPGSIEDTIGPPSFFTFSSEFKQFNSAILFAMRKNPVRQNFTSIYRPQGDQRHGGVPIPQKFRHRRPLHTTAHISCKTCRLTVVPLSAHSSVPKLAMLLAWLSALVVTAPTRRQNSSSEWFCRRPPIFPRVVVMHPLSSLPPTLPEVVK
jgi:hypothetical protein